MWRRCCGVGRRRSTDARGGGSRSQTARGTWSGRRGVSPPCCSTHRDRFRCPPGGSGPQQRKGGRLFADELGDDLTQLPHAFFGHSMGACIAYELALEIRPRGLPEPARLIVSAHRAPHWPTLGPTHHDLPKEEFLARQKEYGGTPEEVFSASDLLDLVVPLLQKDFALFERYRWTAGDPLGCPVTVMGALDDTASGATGHCRNPAAVR
ncbi:thioesterase II family protein [Nonomuraea antimicrobica]